MMMTHHSSYFHAGGSFTRQTYHIEVSRGLIPLKLIQFLPRTRAYVVVCLSVFRWV